MERYSTFIHSTVQACRKWQIADIALHHDEVWSYLNFGHRDVNSIGVGDRGRNVRRLPSLKSGHRELSLCKPLFFQQQNRARPRVGWWLLVVQDVL